MPRRSSTGKGRGTPRAPEYTNQAGMKQNPTRPQYPLGAKPNRIPRDQQSGLGSRCPSALGLAGARLRCDVVLFKPPRANLSRTVRIGTGCGRGGVVRDVENGDMFVESEYVWTIGEWQLARFIIPSSSDAVWLVLGLHGSFAPRCSLD
jgi:hypothetical protein